MLRERTEPAHTGWFRPLSLLFGKNAVMQTPWGALALLRADDCKHGGAADRALALHRRLAIFHGHLLSALHLTFVFAFHAVVKLLCHNRLISLHPVLE